MVGAFECSFVEFVCMCLGVMEVRFQPSGNRFEVDPSLGRFGRGGVLILSKFPGNSGGNLHDGWPDG